MNSRNRVVSVLAAFVLVLSFSSFSAFAEEVAGPGPVLHLAFTDDTGASTTDGITADTELSFTWDAPSDGTAVSYEYNWDAAATYTAIDAPPLAITAADGTHTLTVRAVDAAGAAGQTASISLTVDTAGAAASIVFPAANVWQPVDHCDIRFDEAVDANTVATDDFALTAPAGAVSVDSIQMLDTQTCRIKFAPQSDDGPYTIEVGSDIADMAGNLLDQNGNGTNGEAGDSYSATFSMSIPVRETEDNGTAATAVPLELVEDPAGKGYYTAHGMGTIDPATYGDYWSDTDYWKFIALAGDIVSVSMDTPFSNLDAYIELRDGSDSSVRSDNSDGPGADAYIERYQVPVSGTFYVRAGHYAYNSEGGLYHIRIEVVRGCQLESDRNNANDSVSGANQLVMTAQGQNQTATVAGTIATSGDKDVFKWGNASAGSVVELTTALPAHATLAPKVSLLDANGNAVADEDGNPLDGSCTVTLPSDGQFFACVEAVGGAGPYGQYVLDIKVSDDTAPHVVRVQGLPDQDGTTDYPIGSISVDVNEDLDAATVNNSNRFVGHYNGHAYFLTSATMSWADAQAEAANLGGYLVKIDDESENAFIQQWFASSSPWIGLSIQDTEWKWQDGTVPAFTGWADGQPSGSINYALMNNFGLWYNSTSNSRYGIIELETATDTDSDGVPDVIDVLPAETLNAFDLRAAGPDGSFGTSDDIIYTLSTISEYTTGTRIDLRIVDGPLSTGKYRFSANSTITDIVGNTLDGNGDSIGGDPFQRVFNVQLTDTEQFEGRMNNSYIAAPKLNLVEDPVGSGFFCGKGFGTIDPAVPNDDWDDSDCWKFDAQQGDIVAASVDTPDSSVNTFLSLRWGSDQRAYDYDSGPDYDAFTSHYVIPYTGTWYVWVCRNGGGAGTYKIRVELARGIQAEYDPSYRNDGLSNANALDLQINGKHRTATVAGTIMYPDGGNFDQDSYYLGILSAGTTIQLDTQLPSYSRALPVVTVMNAAGEVLSDEDGLEDGSATVTAPADGEYYARIDSVERWHNGHSYRRMGNKSWADGEAAAQAWGGHLVTINDEEEFQYILANYSRLGDLWLGLTDKDQEGTWVWISGEPVSYTHWASNEPNSGGSYDFAYMNSNSWWYDSYDTGRDIIAERDGAPSQEEYGSGFDAQYLLNVDVADLVPPKITNVTRIPDEGGTTSQALATFSVSVTEDMDASTMTVSNDRVYSFNNHYYFLLGSQRWSDAQAQAESLGGHLVHIDSEAEQQFLERWFAWAEAWIGASDEAVDGTWVWTDQSAVTYTNWAPNEPNSSNYDHAFMNTFGQWEDGYYSHNHRALVELDSATDSDGDGVPDVLDVLPSETLNAWDMREAGADGVFDTADDIIYNVVPGSYSSGTSIGLTITDGPLGNGYYRFSANHTLTDIVGNELDGNSDGTAGDPFQRHFYVALPSDDPFEGRMNNSQAASRLLVPAENPVDSGFYIARGIGSIDNNQDSDCWSFDAEAGDIVSISADTPDSNVNTFVEIRLGTNRLEYDYDDGPDYDAFISRRTLPDTGRYYIWISSGDIGTYRVRLELARGIQMESDDRYSNDGTSGANTLEFALDQKSRNATVAGTIMAPEGGNYDQDTFALGTLSAGVVIDVGSRLPTGSTLAPRVRVLKADGTALTDEDGAPDDGACRVTIAEDGEYFVQMNNMYWGYNGHRYIVRSDMNWADAQAYGESLGGYLVAINDEPENNWLRDTFSNIREYLIGCTDQAQEGTWLWTSGEPFTYTNWNGSEPNSGSSYNWGYSYDGRWYDTYASRTLHAIIELPGDGSGVDYGAGIYAQYLVDIQLLDVSPPQVTSVTLPANGETTSDIIATFDANFTEDMAIDTVSSVNRLVREYNGHYYFFTSSSMKQADGEAEAESLGGHLVTIDDAAEQQFVERWFRDCYIGLSDQGGWKWTDGTEPQYTHWASGEPNTYYYDFVYMGNTGEWYDSHVDTTRPGLIELENATDSDGDGIPDAIDVFPNESNNAWDLREAGADGTFDTADDMIFNVILLSAYSSGTQVKLNIEDGPLPSGHYRLTLNSTLTDIVGNAIDGNGDGTGGDAYQIEFTVALPTEPVFEGILNQSYTSAAELPLTEDPAGSGLFSAMGIGSINPCYDGDYWRDADAWHFEAQQGDVVSVFVDTPGSGLNPRVHIYQPGTNLTEDGYGGQYDDSFISHYTIPSTGSYYIWVRRDNNTPGSYELRLRIARGIQMESDWNYDNDGLDKADRPQLKVEGNTRSATIAGVLMAPENDNFDEDSYALGWLSAGTVIELSTREPSYSTAAPRVQVLSSSGIQVDDQDGSPYDGHLLVTLPEDDEYFVRLEGTNVFGNHVYFLTPNTTWANAEDYAVRFGGHLVTVNSVEEQQWLASTFGGAYRMWIGATDQDVEGIWTWISGETSDYTNWHGSEPNSGSSYNWAYMHMGYSGEWLDERASDSYRGIAEVDAGVNAAAGLGTDAQYLLDVQITDDVPPRVDSVSRLPGDGGSTDEIISTFSVTVSEDLDPASVAQMNRLVRTYNGHTYFLTESSKNWADAEAEAVSYGGHLVKIDDAAEQAFVQRWFSGCFIGLYDRSGWKWPDDTEPQYVNWGNGEPNTYYYDSVYLESTGLWYDEYATNSRYGLIELDSPADADSDGIPDVIDVVADQPLNVWDLREAGTDGTFDTADDTVYTLRLDSAYSSGPVIHLILDDGPLGTGNYRFTVNFPLKDIVGNELDGNGDGVGGDAYQQYFSVAIPEGPTFEGRKNNHYAGATPLQLTEDPSGSGYFIARGIGSMDPANRSDDWNDSDCWSFQAEAGDIISASADALNSSINPFIHFHVPGTSLSDNDNGGPGYGAFVSHYVIQTAGTYYVWVTKYGDNIGSYNLRLELARGIGLESDRDYSNDSIAGATSITLNTVEDHRTGTVAGTIMSPESNNVDEDFFNIGNVDAGESVFLSIRLPEQSTLRPVVEIRDSSNQVAFIAPNPSEGVARADITTPGSYYAVVVGTEGGGTYGQYLLDAAVWPTGALEFADLVVGSITVDATAPSGSTLPISWEVGNYGTGVTDSASWFDKIVLSTNDRYGDSDDILLTSVEHTGTLDPQQTYTGSANVKLPLGLSGSYYVLVHSDANNSVFEYIFETNNTGKTETQLTVTPIDYADLSASGPQVQPVIVAGEDFTITWSVSNAGAGTTNDGTSSLDGTPAIVSEWTDRIVFSRNAVCGDADDVQVAAVVHTGELAAAGSYSGTWTGSLPADGSFSGNYNVFVITDVNDAVYEHADTASNVSGPVPAGVATAPFADLAVPEVTVKSSVKPSEHVTINWTVENTADAWTAAPDASWYDRIYISQDDVFGSDTYLGQFTHQGPIAVGDTDAMTAQVTIPWNLSGRYYIFVKTDYNNSVYEYTHEDNNVSQPVEVHVGDWFVDDDATGEQLGTQQQPFATVQQAVDAALSGDVIKVAEGTYTENITVTGKDLDILGGWSADFAERLAPGYAVIDGNNAGTCVSISDCANGELSGFLITNGNAATGAVALSNASVAITHNIITGNSGGDLAGGIYCSASTPEITNNTIAGNTANVAGGILADNGSTVIVKNSILWNNTAPTGSQIAIGSAGTASTIIVSYSDIAGGISAVEAGNGNLQWASNNIDADPLFAGSDDFHLQSFEGRWNSAADQWVADNAYSPCIDKGDPASQWSNEPQPNKERVNIGAYGNTAEASKSYIATLTVQSTPITGVSITGTKQGATNYTALCDMQETVNLQAPDVVTVDSVNCTFVKWQLDGVDQPAGDVNLSIIISQDVTATAVYEVPGPTMQFSISPTAPNGLDSWYITRPYITLRTTGVGVKEIHYWWDGESETVVNRTSVGFSAAPGDRTLSYYAIDEFDQQGDTQVTSVKYDDSSPSASIELNGTGGPDWFTSPVAVSVSGNGDGLSIISTQLRIDSGAWSSYTGSVTVDTQRYHYVNARVTTSTGKTVTANRNFTIDFTPPVTTVSTYPSEPNGPNGWFVGEAPQVRLRATDVGSSVSEIRYHWNEDAESTVNGSYANLTPPVGTSILYYYAVDRYGQAEAVKQFQINYNDAAADLQVLSIDPITEVWSGNSIEVVYTVKNAGTWEANGFWYDRIYLSEDDQLGSDVQIGNISFKGAVGTDGTYTRTAAVTIPDGIQGQRWIIVKTDATNSLFESADDNNSLATAPITVNLSAYADLKVSDISAPASGKSGEAVEINWTLTNEGQANATGPWADRIYLSNDQQVGNDLLLTTLTYNGSLATQQSLVRTATVTLPEGNVAGDQWIIVRTDTGNDLFELDEDDNVLVDDQALNIPEMLLLNVSTTQIAEDANPATRRVVVKRNSVSPQPLTINLASSDESELTVPATVEIPANSTWTAFNYSVVDDTEIDGPVAVTLTASAAGFESAQSEITVTDDDFAEVTLDIGANQVDEGSGVTVPVTVTRNAALDQDLSVIISATPNDQFNVPASVVIPANETSATFDIVPIDESIVDGVVRVIITASATDFVSGTSPIYINDNDMPTLTIQADRSAIVESASNPAAIGTVTRSLVNSLPLQVKIASSDKTEAVAGPVVEIPANEASVVFPINAMDDDIVDGTKTVTLTASIMIGSQTLTDGQGTTTIDVTDDDGPTLSVSISRSVIAEGAQNPAASGTVRRNTDATDPLVVSLTSSDTTEVTVPAEVTIPAGQAYATFDLSVVNDGTPDGLQTATITAAASGFSDGFNTIDVTDMDMPDLQPAVVDFPMTGLTTTSVQVTWRVTNGGLDTVSGLWYDRLLISRDNRIGGDDVLAELPVSETVAVGDSYERTLTVWLPDRPNKYWIIVQTDVQNSIDEGPGNGEKNNTAVAETFIEVSPAYRATVQTDIENGLANNPVPMHGYAYHSITGDPQPNVPVTVRVVRGNFRRVIDTMSDNNGEFDVTFNPLRDEGGTYTICADHPNVTEDTTQDTFKLIGMKFSPRSVSHRIFPGTPLTATVDLSNISDVPLTDITASYDGLAPNLSVETNVESVLAGDGKLQLEYTLTASDASVGWNQFGLRLSSAEGTEALLVMNVKIEPQVPRLVSNPGVLKGGMLRGQQKMVQFQINNVGGAPSGELSVMLPDESWMSLISSPTIPSIAPGESAVVMLALNPDENLPLLLYHGSVVVANNDASLSIPFEFRAVSDAVGSLQVTVVDEYTYYQDGAPKVAGADVVLKDPYDHSVIASGISDASGIALLTDVREGEYVLEVRADRHSTYRAGQIIEPGTTSEVETFLARQTVTYNWSVVPTEIEDHYQVRLETTFETNVPIPVVTIDNPFVMPLVVEGETTQVDVKVTNHGLIAAQGVKLNLPSTDLYEVTQLVDDVEMIPAKTTITIPFLIRMKEGALADSCSTCGSGSQTQVQIGGACEDDVNVDVVYYYVCGDDNKWHAKSMNVRPIRAAKGLWDCLKALGYPPDVIKEMRGDLRKLPAWLINALCSCMDIDKCACALLKIAAGAVAGSSGGPWGAAAGAASEAGGLWDCICFSIDGGGSTGSTDSGPLPNFGWGGGGSTSGSVDRPYSDPVSYSTPSGGCSPGDVSGANVETRQIISYVTSELPAAIQQAVQEEPQAGVCARVKLRIDQDMVMTRAAFLGTLEIDNADEQVSLEGISVSLDFNDMDGNPAEDKFAYRPPELSGITAVDGTGTLAPATTGSAKYIFIPTNDAAPDAPTRYQIGGTLRYIDNGEEVTMPLLPATITVYPDASLRLRYFHQRDVYSDDPFTDEVEPAEPFTLGLLVTNVGKGAARNVSITSAQPKIIENEKGLLIDFKIIGTQVGSQQVQPSLTVNLGNIDPGETTVGRWLLVSTLQGKFIDYSATYEHLDAIGDKRTSLIEGVEIHELIHTVLADRANDDDLPDFLVNDDEDEDDIADTVYFSDGSVAPVSAILDGQVTQQALPDGGLEVHVDVNAPSGWIFVRIPDPGGDEYELSEVTRSDGQPVLVDENAWTTHRWNRPVDQDPYRQHRLQLFDFDSTGSYTLHYNVNWSARDQVAPASSVVTLEPVTRSTQFQLQWSGQDEQDGSGIDHYDIYMSRDGGAYSVWKRNTTATGAIFNAAPEHTYSFYSIAVDKAGNAESAPDVADAETYIPDLIPPTITAHLAQQSDSGVLGDNATSDDTPVFSGGTEALANVTLQIAGPNGYTLQKTVQAGTDGTWQVLLAESEALPEGVSDIEVSAVDKGGNPSLNAAALAVRVDMTPPTSSADLPAESSPMIRVSWNASDGAEGAGVDAVDVYVAEDGGDLALWQSGLTGDHAYYRGDINHTYQFCVTARDKAGNIEQKVLQPESSTTTVQKWAVPGDTNLDCKVNILDLIFIRNRLNREPGSNNNWQADVNLDGRINIIDLIVVRNRLHDTCE